MAAMALILHSIHVEIVYAGPWAGYMYRFFSVAPPRKRLKLISVFFGPPSPPENFLLTPLCRLLHFN